MKAWLIAAAIVALPLGIGSTAVGQSEAPLDPMGANYWTGTWTYAEGGTPTSETPMAGYTEILGSEILGEVEADDPRISGTMRYVQTVHSAASRDPDEGDVGIAHGTVRIDNDEGAWVGTYSAFGGGPGGEEWYVLEGEGAYEGLTTIFRWQDDPVAYEGVIVPAPIPVLPDPVAPAP